MDISTITIPNPPAGAPALPFEGKATTGKATGGRSTENSEAVRAAAREGQVDRSTDGDFGKLVQAARTKPLPQAGDAAPAASPGSTGPEAQATGDVPAPATSARESHKTARNSRRAAGKSLPAPVSPAPSASAPVSPAKVANSATGPDHKAVANAKAEALNTGGPKTDHTKAGTAARSVTGKTAPAIAGAKPPTAAKAGTRSTVAADPDGRPIVAAGVAVVADAEESDTPPSTAKAAARHQAADPQGPAAAARPVAIPIMTMRPLGRSTGAEVRRGDGQLLFAAGAAVGKGKGAGMRAANGVLQSNGGSRGQSAAKSSGQSAGKSPGKSPGKSTAAQMVNGPTGAIELSGPTSDGPLDRFMKAVIARPESGNAVPSPAGAGDGPAKAGLPPAELSPAITPAHHAALSIKGIAQSHSAQATAPARGPAPGPGLAQQVTQQVAVYISRAAREGANRFSIRLHPAELGHVKVSMEVSRDGHVSAVLSAERPETLDLLQRDSRALERALQDSGLKTDAGSLNFSLQGQDRESPGAHRSSRFDGLTADTDRSAPVDDIIMAMGSGAGRRALDISV